MAKERIDKLLVKKDLFSSRSKAKRAIMAGKIYVEQQLVDKAGTKVKVDSKINVKGKVHPYVGRGGLKLAKAIKEFKLDFSDKIVLDIGASTGGFTDCALQNGASKVYAVDVGYNQLAWRLRSDDRVVVKEKTNARYLDQTEIEEKFSMVTIDVSFISLTKIIPALKDFLKADAELITLIKPQFEAGPDKVGSGGVVKDPEIHKEVILKIIDFSKELGFNLKGLSFSPITGGKKSNIEYLACFSMQEEEIKDIAEKIDSVIKQAHNKHYNK